MLKAFICIMLVVSAASAFPSGGDIAKSLLVSGGQMSVCILKRKASSAAGNLWNSIKGRIWGRRRLLTRNLNMITDMAKGAAKKVALPLCNAAGFKLLEIAAKAKTAAYWDGDAQACGRELVSGECQRVLNAW